MVADIFLDPHACGTISFDFPAYYDDGREFLWSGISLVLPEDVARLHRSRNLRVYVPYMDRYFEFSLYLSCVDEISTPAIRFRPIRILARVECQCRDHESVIRAPQGDRGPPRKVVRVSDESMRELERLAAEGDPVARERLRVEQVRMGLRKSFPPKRRMHNYARIGVSFPGWCPVCKTWNLWRSRQSDRSKRGKQDSRGGRVRGTGVVPVEFFRDRPVVYARMPRRFRKIEGRKRAAPTRVCRYSFQSEWYTQDGGVRNHRDCPGPARGQPCRPPLEALEARLAEHDVAFTSSFPEERSWLVHRIQVERRRLGIKGPCSHSRLDYLRRPSSGEVMVDRSRLRCEDCGATIDTDTGKDVGA